MGPLYSVLSVCTWWSRACHVVAAGFSPTGEPKCVFERVNDQHEGV